MNVILSHGLINLQHNKLASTLLTAPGVSSIYMFLSVYSTRSSCNTSLCFWSKELTIRAVWVLQNDKMLGLEILRVCIKFLSRWFDQNTIYSRWLDIIGSVMQNQLIHTTHESTPHTLPHTTSPTLPCVFLTDCWSVHNVSLPGNTWEVFFEAELRNNLVCSFFIRIHPPLQKRAHCKPKQFIWCVYDHTS